MDLTLCYRNFVVDDRELMFHSVLGTVPSFHDEEGNLYCAIAAFQHQDAVLARDPLSTNHRSTDATRLAMFGTLVVVGFTLDYIRVLIPDTVGTMVNADSPLALQHVVGLRLGTPVDLSSSLPPAPGLFPLIWHAIFDLNIRPVNASGAVLSPQSLTERIIWRRHAFSARAMVALTTNVCANLDWNGLAVARSSTREEIPAKLYGWTSHSHGNPDRNYITTMSSPTVQRLMNCDYSSVQRSGNSFTLTSTFHDLKSILHLHLLPQGDAGFAELLKSTMIARQDIHQDRPPKMISWRQRHCWVRLGCPRLLRQVPSATMANSRSSVEQITDILSSESDQTQLHVPLSRGAVSNVSLASTDLLSHVELLPLNQLICHSAATVRSWPAARPEELLAVAYRDMAVASRNMADLTRYLDIQSTHIAACSGRGRPRVERNF